MAYGMLTSFALGAAEGLGNAIVNKYSKDQDAEIKAKADAEREARIEEAAIRAENRVKLTADTNYARLRQDTLTDKESEHNWTRESERLKQESQTAEDIAKEKRTQDWATNPDNPAYQATMSQIEADKTSMLNSESARKSQEINQKLSQMELDKKIKISDLQNRIQSTTDENEAKRLKSQLIWLEGKSDEPTIQKMSIDTGRIDPATRKPIEEDILVKVDKITGKWETLDVAGRLKEGKPFTKEEATAIAKAEADADPKIGVRTSNWFTEDNATKYDDYVNSRVVELTNTPRGMLNSKSEGKTSPVTSTDKAIQETVKTATANPLIKFTDDPVKQGQFDTINGVILYSESSTKGANVGRPKPTKDNPHPTADGSYQLTNIAMKDLGIPPDLPNGEYSVASKEKAAPSFYAKAYNDTQGDATAYLAYRFAPTDIKNAVEKSKKKGGYWWEYAQSDFTKENMPTVVRDAKRTMLQLGRENKPVPTEIQRLILAYK